MAKAFTKMPKPIKLKKIMMDYFYLVIAYSGTFQKMSYTDSFNVHENTSPSLAYT